MKAERATSWRMIVALGIVIKCECIVLASVPADAVDDPRHPTLVSRAADQVELVGSKDESHCQREGRGDDVAYRLPCLYSGLGEARQLLQGRKPQYSCQ
jgi:hypothetical protein